MESIEIKILNEKIDGLTNTLATLLTTVTNLQSFIKKSHQFGEWLTRLQVAELLNCKLGKVDKLRSQGKIKLYNLDGMKRFKKEEIMEYLNTK